MFGIGRLKKYSHKIKLAYEIHNKNVGRKQTISIMDVLASNIRNQEWIRLDVVVCYMAIEAYYKGDKGWDYLYNKMLGDQSGEELLRFIKTTPKDEFNSELRVLLDKDLNIVLGTQYLALALYYHIEQIPVRIISICEKNDRSVHWLMSKGFSNAELESVVDTAREILETEKSKNELVAVVWNTVVEFDADIKEDINLLQRNNIKITNAYHYKYLNQEDYENIVRRIYSVDDVEGWKIEKKIEHMGKYNPELTLLKLKLNDPQFRIKSLSHMPISIVGEQLKYALRSRYQGMVKDYYFDIVFHAADNYTQSGFINALFFNNIEMKDIISILNKYDYAFMKIEAPGIPKDFPSLIPLGKDIDTLIRKEDADNISNEIIEYLEKTVNEALIIKKTSDLYSTAIRVEIFERLVFQIDLVHAHNRLSESYVTDALKRRKLIPTPQSYYVLSDADEYLYRLVAFRENPKKRQHYDYLVSKYKNYSRSALNKYCYKDLRSLLILMRYIGFKASNDKIS